MKRLLTLTLIGILTAAGGTTACERVITQPADTVFVNTPPTVRTDTVVRTRTDTVYRVRVDTALRVDTLTSPPRIDTLLTYRVDTVKTVRTDTVVVTQVVIKYDTTWVYVQTNPTNPLAAGDTAAGIAYVPTPVAGNYIVLWHGHFVGVVRQKDDATWSAFVYTALKPEMLWAGDYPTLAAATEALRPIEVYLHLNQGLTEPSVIRIVHTSVYNHSRPGGSGINP